MKQYLEERGVKNIVEEQSAKNTIENAVYCSKIVKKEIGEEDQLEIKIITSDFHVKRSKMIFEHYFKFKSEFISAKTPISSAEYDKLLIRESKFIKNL